MIYIVWPHLFDRVNVEDAAHSVYALPAALDVPYASAKLLEKFVALFKICQRFGFFVKHFVVAKLENCISN